MTADLPLLGSNAAIWLKPFEIWLLDLAEACFSAKAAS
ncbi:hypothetical protein MAXJ12_36296 [Mesorhizobium alhagi CCNWXJ12-2]|uniref:Uncharacterized protein n=1 Tax=Mesorhizobium alhagi CCNWXJ12-2 TaxID=1107882 RepID=H0I436_9HYPH|nr:hypothetical protein MAXJ12_36296 [Mesorhizobium alhagi CCNWXJ12-2]